MCDKMKILMCLAVFFLFSKLDASPLPNGEMSAIMCITSQNLEGYAQKIALLVSQDKIPTDDKKLNKFMGCHWKNKGLIDENGNVDIDSLRTYLENIFANGSTVDEYHRKIANNVVEQCRSYAGKNPGQSAIVVQNCITAYLPNYE